MELQTRSKRSITRSIEDIGIAFRFYSMPERWRGTFHLYAMARPSGLFGEGLGTPEEYVHLLTHYGIQGVINFDGGYQDENRPYYQAARAAGIHVNNDPNNAIPDRNNDVHLSWLLNALIVIDRAHQRRPRASVCINCAAGQGRSGTIVAAWMIREAVRSGEAALDQELSAQAFGSLQPARFVAVYPIVQQVIAALREQQQRQGPNASAVESIVQVRLLNRYYEYLIRERRKRKLINNFRGGPERNESSSRSKSQDDDDDKYGRGFWSTFGRNILEYFVHGTRHLRTGSDVGDIISGVFSPAVGIEISKRSVSPPPLDIKCTILPRGTRFSPLLRAMQKIGRLLNEPATSWVYQGYEEPAEITTWVRSPFAQVFYTCVHEGEFQRIYVSFDFSPITDTIELNEQNVLTLSGQKKQELLRKFKIINLSWFITTLSGTEGRVGTINETTGGSLDDIIEVRVVNEFDNLGSAGAEYGEAECWALGKFMPPDMPWPEEFLGKKPPILFTAYKEHTDPVTYLVPGPVTSAYRRPDGSEYLSTPMVEWSPKDGQGLARLAGVTIHASRFSPHLARATLKTSDPERPITIKVEQTGIFEDEEFEFHLWESAHSHKIGPAFHTFNFFLKKMPMFTFTCKNKEGEDTWSVEGETRPVLFWRESGDLYHVYDFYYLNDMVLFAGYLLAKHALEDDGSQFKAGRKESWLVWREAHVVEFFRNTPTASWDLPPAVLTMGDGSRVLLFTKDDMEFFSRPRFQVNLCRVALEEENTCGLLCVDHHGRIAAWDIVCVEYNPDLVGRYESGYFDESGHCRAVEQGGSLGELFGPSSGISKASHFARLTKTDETLESIGCTIFVASNIQPLAVVLEATNQIEKFGRNWLSAFKEDSTDFWNMASKNQGKILFHTNKCFSLALDSMQLHSLFPMESFDRSSVNTDSYETLGMAYFDQRGRVVGIIMVNYNYLTKNITICYTYDDNMWQKTTSAEWLIERERTGSWSPSCFAFSVF